MKLRRHSHNTTSLLGPLLLAYRLSAALISIKMTFHHVQVFSMGLQWPTAQPSLMYRFSFKAVSIQPLYPFEARNIEQSHESEASHLHAIKMTTPIPIQMVL